MDFNTSWLLDEWVKIRRINILVYNCTNGILDECILRRKIKKLTKIIFLLNYYLSLSLILWAITILVFPFISSFSEFKMFCTVIESRLEVASS